VTTPGPTILETMEDPALFGPWFTPGAPWRSWRAFLAALFGLPLSEPLRMLYQAHTGRTTPPTTSAREAWMVVGRRGGKSRIAALVAVYLATFRDYRAILAPGEKGTVMLLAADRRQARVLMRYVTGLLEGVPMLAQLIVARTAESVTLSTGIVLEIHTSSFRAVRGYTVIAAILDEVAFWPTGEESANPDVEVLNALLPATATVPEALILGLSSPYSRRGLLWEKHRTHYGRTATSCSSGRPTRGA
jgi:phage terminase large subunit-like protein